MKTIFNTFRVYCENQSSDTVSFLLGPFLMMLFLIATPGFAFFGGLIQPLFELFNPKYADNFMYLLPLILTYLCVWFTPFAIGQLCNFATFGFRQFMTLIFLPMFAGGLAIKKIIIHHVNYLVFIFGGIIGCFTIFETYSIHCYVFCIWNFCIFNTASPLLNNY